MLVKLRSEEPTLASHLARRADTGVTLVLPFSLPAPVCPALAWADFFLIAGDEAYRLTITQRCLG